MKTCLNRRVLLSSAGALGLEALLPWATSRADDRKAEAGAATFVGQWTYRSFFNIPDITVGFEKLEFARADLQIDQAPPGVLAGKLSFGSDYLTLKGNVTYGNPFTARFQGRGATTDTLGWIYDYLGFLVPAWPDGIDQRPAIVGTVIRTVPHSNGQSKAGQVASFIAVKRDA
jgi:hypothetical protein